MSVILIDSVLRTGKNYKHEAFLEECKYVVKKEENTNYKFLLILIKKILMKKFWLKKLWQRKFWWGKSWKNSDKQKFWQRKFWWRKLTFFYIYKYHQKLPGYRKNYYLAHKK